MYNDCTLCPRNCHVDRTKFQGFCGGNDKLKVARASLHYFEEPCISGDNGSGTIFFSNCNLKCVFCQNENISSKSFGKFISVERLSEICLELQEKGANNINLVTPTHYVYSIVEAIKLAKEKGLIIPIIYNTSSYENINTIKLLDGLIDIYLPDLKYMDDKYAVTYSNAPNYFDVASSAIMEMYKQVGKPKFNSKGIMTKGIIVRHLILPGLSNDSKNIIKYLHDTYKNNIYISIMNQYTPIKKFIKFPILNNKVSKLDYEDIIDYACSLGIKKAFVQEDGTCSESFIPDFNNDGV